MKPQEPPTDVGGGTAMFNQAMYQQMRLHDFMKTISKCFVNLLGEEEGIPNYHRASQELKSFCAEVGPSFSKKEKAEVDLLKAKVNLIIREGKFYSEGKKSLIASEQKFYVLNTPAYELLEETLENFRDIILEYAHLHGYGNPTKQDPSSAVVT